MEKSTLESEAMQIAHYLARKRFRFDPDREAKIQDAMSLAWELAQTAADDATGSAVGYYAVKRVMMKRQFSQSERSIDNPRDPRRVIAAQRESLQPSLMTRPGDNPAEVVCFWMTFLPWLKSLSPRNRQVAVAFILGDSTGSVAEQFSLSATRVSQLRRELQEDWEVFTA